MLMMLRTTLSNTVRSQALTSRVAFSRVQSRACSQCKSVKDWKELHGAWSRYTVPRIQRRDCSQCKSVKEWKELHGAWSRTQSSTTQFHNPSSSFSTSAYVAARRAKDTNPSDPAFGGPKNARANTEPKSQPGSGKPAGTNPPDDTPEVPDELRTAGDPTKNAPEEPDLPLPDLTKGIPSTIGQELERAERQRRGEESKEEEESFHEATRGSRARPSNDTVTSVEKRRSLLFKLMMGVATLGGLGFFIYQGRDWENEEEAAKHRGAPSGTSVSGFYNRLQARLNSTVDYYNEPAFQKLLPDPDPMWARPYTLVLSLEDLLVHQEWSREHGWRLAKRPGVDYFLRYLSQYYEIVIFTSLPSMAADPIIRKLDPYRFIMWPLYREATKYKNGEYIKDLSFLNRDLAKTVLVDTSVAHASAQPENAIILPKWQGDAKDRDLVSLIPFLEFVAGCETPDLRKALAGFNGKHIPTEFARREAELRRRILESEAAKGGKRSGGGGISGFLGLSQDSGRGDGMQSLGAGLKEGKILHDRIREQGQRAYAELEKQIRENGEKMLAEWAAEEEKMRQEQMKSMTSGFSGFFGGKGPGNDGSKPSGDQK